MKNIILLLAVLFIGCGLGCSSKSKIKINIDEKNYGWHFVFIKIDSSKVDPSVVDLCDAKFAQIDVRDNRIDGFEAHICQNDKVITDKMKCIGLWEGGLKDFKCFVFYYPNPTQGDELFIRQHPKTDSLAWFEMQESREFDEILEENNIQFYKQLD